MARPWRLFFGSACESHARCFEKQQLVSFLGPPARSRDETSACFLIDVGVAFSSGSVTALPRASADAPLVRATHRGQVPLRGAFRPPHGASGGWRLLLLTKPDVLVVSLSSRRFSCSG